MSVAVAEAQPQIQSWRQSNNCNEARGGPGGSCWIKLYSFGYRREECSKTLTTGQINLVQRQTNAISAHPASRENYSQSQHTVSGTSLLKCVSKYIEHLPYVALADVG